MVAQQIKQATLLNATQLAVTMRQTAKSAIVDVQNNLNAGQNPSSGLNAKLPNFEGYLITIKTAGQLYQNNVQEAVNAAMNSAAKMDGMNNLIISYANTYGFVSAGTFYTAYANGSYKVEGAIKGGSAVDVKLIKPSENAPTLYQEAYRYFDTAKQKISPSGLSASESKSDESSAFNQLMDKIGYGGSALVGSFIRHDLTTPALVNIKNTADDIVFFTGLGMSAIGAIKTLKDESFYGWLAKASGSYAAVASGAIGPWLDMALFAFEISVGFFLMCSIYLPLVPFIVFMGQILEWLASVALGIAAAPFLAFAHFDTDGEGLGQRTSYGYTFMLQSFMRPVLLILGFVLAAAMIEISIATFTVFYTAAIVDVQIHSMTGLIACLGYIALYMVVCVGLVNMSCSLMYIIPDAIMQFMGASSPGLGFRDTQNVAQSSVAGGAGLMVRGAGKTAGGIDRAKDKVASGDAAATDENRHNEMISAIKSSKGSDNSQGVQGS